MTRVKACRTVRDDELNALSPDVYITNTSSSTGEWLSRVARHGGDHYMVPKDRMEAMQIPGYRAAIPHYLIYDREGRLVKFLTGWPGVDAMMHELKVEN